MAVAVPISTGYWKKYDFTYSFLDTSDPLATMTYDFMSIDNSDKKLKLWSYDESHKGWHSAYLRGLHATGLSVFQKFDIKFNDNDCPTYEPATEISWQIDADNF